MAKQENSKRSPISKSPAAAQNPALKYFHKSEVIRYGIELLIVMCGVFMGIMAGEWNSDRHLNQQRKLIMTNLKSEIKQNAAQLDRAIKYHTKIAATLDSLWLSSDQKQLAQLFLDGRGFNQIPGWHGLGVSILENSVYESARISDVFSGMELPMLTGLSRIYREIDGYNQVGRKLQDRLFDINSQTKFIDVLLTIEIVRGDILGYEKYIKTQLETFAGQMEE
jgi:hypothetical protein